MKEEHISLVRQPGNHFVGHVTPKAGSGTDVKDAIFPVLRDRGLLPSCKVVGTDSTAANTGKTKGAITLLEEELGHRLVWLVCMLHTNELPFRHLFIALDGETTSSDKSFVGPLGVLCKSVEKLEINL